MEYFSITELCKSEDAIKFSIENNPTPQACDNLITLIDAVLDPARVALGRVIRPNSGYRCPELNRVVRGAKYSQHVTGEAADVELGGRTAAENEELYNWIRDNCEYDQLINEYNFAWVHVSYRKGKNRKQQLKLG